MSEKKWTPGPWNIVETDKKVFGLITDDGDMIADLADARNAEANANLIAAAPDLLEACEDLPIDEFDLVDLDIDAAEFVDNCNAFIDAMRKAKAALSKARGES